MTTSAIDICNTALVMIGASPISSFTDGTTESLVAANTYEPTIRDLLTRHRWRFMVTQQQLDRLTAGPPAAVWKAAYQLPADTLMVVGVTVNDTPIDYDRFEDRIFCDAAETDEVIMESGYRVDEQFWPPYFITLAIMRMASIFAGSITGDVTRADWLDKQALRQLAAARSLDSQAQTSRKLDTKGLLRGRF